MKEIYSQIEETFFFFGMRLHWVAVTAFLFSLLLFDVSYAGVHIPSYYVVDTQLRAANENLGHALSTAASVFGSRLDASANELKKGLQGIGLQTVHELAPKVDAFNTELRNAMGTFDTVGCTI